MKKNKKTLLTKIQESYPEFESEVAGLTIPQLNDKLATLAKYLEESQLAKEADEELERAKELAKELGAPYRDAKKALQLKSKYVISLLKEKGGA